MKSSCHSFEELVIKQIINKAKSQSHRVNEVKHSSNKLAHTHTHHSDGSKEKICEVTHSLSCWSGQIEWTAVRTDPRSAGLKVLLTGRNTGRKFPGEKINAAPWKGMRQTESEPES